METVPELEPARVIAWLRSPEGERWSLARIGFCGRLFSCSGYAPARLGPG